MAIRRRTPYRGADMPSDVRARPITHSRPAEGEANEILAFQRAMFWMRLIGLVIIVTQAPLYEMVHPAIVVASVLVVIGTMAVQRRALGDGLSIMALRQRAIALLVADMTAVYLVGTAFAADTSWVGFYFYPLLSLEATLVAGLVAGAAVTAISLAAYLIQLALHLTFAADHPLRETLGAMSLVALTGGFMALYAWMAQRDRRDLRLLLDLTSAMGNQEGETQAIELLDRRLRDAIGARVRSVAVRAPDGSYEIVRWHTEERRTITVADIEHGMGSIDSLNATFASGSSLTFPVETWSVIGAALGLPEWTRSVTLVPIFAEGRWIGILPVLWSSPTVPTTDQLRLLHGLAGQVGLALAQGQIRRIRTEAATDPLTSLLNRRAILDELAEYVARAQRSNGRVAVLFGDLDGFREINNSRGHQAGDRALRTVAAAVRGAVRQGDVVGRYGGDELLVVAADADTADAVVLAGRIGVAVRDVAGADGLDITLGIAVYPADGADANALLAAADAAMYRGKARGRGRAVVASQPDQDDLGLLLV
jgi:diguanylate cyclase (GGDEF)-like protein